MPVTIYPGYHLNILQPQLCYYLDTRGPGKTRRSFNSTFRSGFLKFSAEIRNRIYSHAVVLDSPIDRPPTRRTDPRLRTAGWEQRAEVTTCFNFLLTCKTVHDEASPVFWGCNDFIVDLRPAVRLQTVFDTLAGFRDWDVWLSAKVGQSLAGVERTALVTDIKATSNEKYSHVTNIPVACELEAYVDTSIYTQTALHQLKTSEEVRNAGHTYVEISTALTSLANAGYLPGLQTVGVSGTLGRPFKTAIWHGLDLNQFKEESPFMARFEDYVVELDVNFQFLGATYKNGPCRLCGAPWDGRHWAEDNDDLACPGFADDELGGELVRCGVDADANPDYCRMYGGVPSRGWIDGDEEAEEWYEDEDEDDDEGEAGLKGGAEGSAADDALEGNT